MNKQRNDRVEFLGILRSALKDDSNVLIESGGRRHFNDEGQGRQVLVPLT